MLTKFSFLFFFPIAAVIVLVARRRRPRIGALAIAALVAIVVVWAGYRFHFGTIKAAHPQGEWAVAEAAPKFARPLAVWFANKVPIPAPLFVTGIAMVNAHDRFGHFTYLLGRTSNHGWWYYFPVVFFLSLIHI